MRAIVLSSLLFMAGITAADPVTHLKTGGASSVLLTGSSNVTSWRCRGKAIEADMTVPTSSSHINEVIDRIENGNIGPWMSDPSKGRFATPEFRLRVPVDSFRCGNRIMETDLRRALKASDHPYVEFIFHELRGGIRHDVDAGVFHTAISGELSLAGVKRTIDLNISARRQTPAVFRFQAAIPLRMTHFGITPPTALFGAVKARDELKVGFDLTLQIAAKGQRP